MSEHPPAGWFPDPDRPGGLRYWDGSRWTDSRHEGGPAPAGMPGTRPADKPGLRLPGASYGSRAAADVLDTFVIVLIGILFGLAAYLVVGDKTFDDEGDPVEYYAVWGIVGFFVALLLYRPLWMATHRGQTIGKRLVHIRVVRQSTGEPITGRAWLREFLVKPLLWWFIPFAGLIDVLWPIWNEHNLALHDIMCDTRVVRDVEAPIIPDAGEPIVATTSAADAFGAGSGGRDAFGNPL